MGDETVGPGTVEIVSGASMMVLEGKRRGAERGFMFTPHEHIPFWGPSSLIRQNASFTARAATPITQY